MTQEELKLVKKGLATAERVGELCEILTRDLDMGCIARIEKDRDREVSRLRQIEVKLEDMACDHRWDVWKAGTSRRCRRCILIRGDMRV